MTDPHDPNWTGHDWDDAPDDGPNPLLTAAVVAGVVLLIGVFAYLIVGG